VIDLTTLATVHRGDVCLTTYTIEWADTTAYNTVSENYLFIQGAQNDQLTVNANIQKTMTNDIKIKATNADTSTLSPAIKVNEFCKPLVKDSTYPVSIIKSVI
jgi:cobalamin biosynthesis protein CbiG